jgi:AcrR family transcriptional regulator
MKVQETRPYRMQARAEAAEETANSILGAATTAFGSTRFADVTLRQIADAAGVSVQTVIRRFGSKEGLIDAVVDRERTRVAAQREVPDGADLRRRIEILVDHYEEDGDVVLHLLSEEDRSPEIARVVAEGRRTHRTWVEVHLPEIFASIRGAEHRQFVDAAVAATDLYTWKLLRWDVGRSSEEVVEVMVRILEGLRKETP